MDLRPITGAFSAEEKAAVPDSTRISVSYTHLDVYKRQVVNNDVFGLFRPTG